MNFKVSRGIITRPVKVVLYGVEGIGKTTFASKFPKPLFLDLDNGSARIDVDRVQGIPDWNSLIAVVKSFAQSTDNPYATLVIDTADAAARLCESYIINTKVTSRTKEMKSIEDFSYGKGYKMLSEEFAHLLVWLETCIDQGYNVVLLAHAMMRTVTQPDNDGNYDHWELKLPGSSVNKLGPLVKEWSDLLLFADYKTILVDTKDGFGKKKARGGKRVMYTTHTPFADAKNRFGLDDVMEFEYEKIAKLIPERVKKATATPVKQEMQEVQEVQESQEAAPEPEPEPKPEPEQEPKPKQARASRKKKPEPKPDTEAVKKLRALMAEANIKEKDVIDALVLKGICLSTAKLTDFNDGFIETNLIAPWDGVKRFILDTMPF